MNSVHASPQQTLSGNQVLLYVIFSLSNLLWSLSAVAEFTATVDYVIDGDTVILDNEEKVRLIGINAPETEYQDRPAQPYSLEAKLALQELVLDKSVVVVPGRQETDRFGRTLAHLFVKNGINVQKALLQKGYAVVIAVPPNIDHIQEYDQVEQSAREKQLGIWRISETVVDLDQSKPDIAPGFHIVSAAVSRMWQSKRNKYLELGQHLSIQIPARFWESYWKDSNWNERGLEELIGAKVEARGWVTHRNGDKFMIIQHPSMIKLTTSQIQ